MPSTEQRETLTLDLRKRRSTEINDNKEEEEEEYDDEEREIEELEREVKEMADKILESRRTMPDRILEALNSYLTAQRPQICSLSLSDPSKELRENAESSAGSSMQEADPKLLDRLQTFRDKAAKNIAVMPVILTRMNDCIARLDKLDQYNVNLHPAFKRKRTW